MLLSRKYALFALVLRKHRGWNIRRSRQFDFLHNTYLLRTPSDVEYSESDPMLAEAYQSLIAQQDLIISHIYATGQTVIPPNE